jgi:hypothetical protein
MSYISLLLPAFHLCTTDINEISKQCSLQFNLPQDKFELLEIKNNTSQINYGIKFNESYLSLSSIEDLIYQKNCMQSLSEKVFESLHSMNQKLNEVINSFKNDIVNDNQKLKEFLSKQIDYSDNFRLNTEKTLNKIKDEFKNIVQELETLKNKSNSKDDFNNNLNFKDIENSLDIINKTNITDNGVVENDKKNLNNSLNDNIIK